MFISLCKELARGSSVARAYMHESIRGASLSGKVVDIGGGRGASYLAYMNTDNATIEGFDLKDAKGVVMKVDFETDRLPREDGTMDAALMFNILEHIYRHGYLMSEVARVLRKGGSLIGFVPFLVNYHPDPHDYFRYTKEALARILDEAGFAEVSIRSIGGGPFMVNINNLAPSLPRTLLLILFPFYYALDSIIVFLRPRIVERYPLGYLFTGKKR